MEAFEYCCLVSESFSRSDNVFLSSKISLVKLTDVSKKLKSLPQKIFFPSYSKLRLSKTMTTKPAHMNVYKSGIVLNKHQSLAEAIILQKTYVDFGTGGNIIYFSIRQTFIHIRIFSRQQYWDLVSTYQLMSSSDYCNHNNYVCMMGLSFDF